MRYDHFFIFDGLNSADYGLLLSGPETTEAPERDVSSVQVPGRSGDLLIDNGRFKNRSLRYRAAIIRDFESRFAAFKTALLLRTGVRRLEDSIHPEEFRLAAFKGPIAPETTPFNKAGEFTLEFDAKPQRYLRSGERAIRPVSGGTLLNPGFPALPLITVWGSGAGLLRIGDGEVAFTERFTGPVILDCDTQNAYYGVENKNKEISAPAFPVLPAGESRVSWCGGVERVELVPRWWTV